VIVDEAQAGFDHRVAVLQIDQDPSPFAGRKR
jgi:hypothetical protein